MGKRKPVVEVTPERMYDYEFQAKIYRVTATGDFVETLASDSLDYMAGRLSEFGSRHGRGVSVSTEVRAMSILRILFLIGTAILVSGSVVIFWGWLEPDDLNFFCKVAGFCIGLPLTFWLRDFLVAKGGFEL